MATNPHPAAFDEAAPEPGEGARLVRTHRLPERDTVDDWAAEEAPLEIRIGEHAFATVMRTPGNDLELVRGLLHSEALCASSDPWLSIRHCSVSSERPGEDSSSAHRTAENVVRVTPRPGIALSLDGRARRLTTTSSCGVCGKASIEQVMEVARPLDPGERYSLTRFEKLPEQLRREQPLFARTGGLHAAALVDAEGLFEVVREDVGRHNAVDKCVGWALAEGRMPARGRLLLVSGRVSFEIVQKALTARIAAIAAVSAPSSLAIELAEASGLLLVAFLRGDRFNAYGQVERLA